MKRHLVVLIVTIALSTFAFAAAAHAQTGGITNFQLPYGPPAPAAIPLGLMFVNQINLPNGTSQDVSAANFYATLLGQNTIVNGCIYQDLVSGPIWQAATEITKVGATEMTAPTVTLWGAPTGSHDPQTYYFAYFETGNAPASVYGFETDQYKNMQQVLNADEMRWWSTSYSGTMCPSSLESFTPAEPIQNLAAFYLHP